MDAMSDNHSSHQLRITMPRLVVIVGVTAVAGLGGWIASRALCVPVYRTISGDCDRDADGGQNAGG